MNIGKKTQMKTHILRRNSDAFFRDFSGDWIACKVMHVSGSGYPSNEITVKFVTRGASMSGFVSAGVVLERPAIEVVPASAIKFSEYGHSKSVYQCQETYPERKKKQRVTT